MATTIIQQVELELRNCPECGAFVALPPRQWERRQEGRDSQGYFCPNGHQRGWWETPEQRERKRAEQAEAKVRELAAHNDNLLREVSQKATEISRLQKRGRGGVCLQCHRTFQNVARHMATQHKAADGR